MRKQELKIHLDPALLEALRKEAEEKGVSLGEIIRRALRQFLDARERA